MDEVTSIDKINKKIFLDEKYIEFDDLIIAPGAKHSYFGKNSWEKFAPGLKTLNDALVIREKIILSLEEAEKINDEEEIKKYLTFVIVGGGPTGVELAGAIAEIAKQTMVKDYKSINSKDTKIYLIEGLPRILSSFPEKLSRKAHLYLEKLGVKIILNKMVTGMNENCVEMGEDIIKTKNIIWAAGNAASPLLKTLNTDLDKAGRVIVNKDCSIKDYPNIFVIGDAASFKDDEGKLLPGVAQVAIQQGKYVAKIIEENIPPDKRESFKYVDKGNLATIGKGKAIADIKGLKLSGFFAWLVWSFVHIFYLIGFRNRFKVMAEWIWFYITKRQGIRLIVGKAKNDYINKLETNT
jgi:NADH dehydrogenase